MRLKPLAWVLAGFVLTLAAVSWYIGRVNSSHPALWAMIGGDAGRTFTAKVPLPAKADVLWTYTLGADLRQRAAATGAITMPVVWKDGTVYAGFGSKVHAVGPDGKRKWAWEGRTPIIDLALGRQGTLYVLTDGTLYALNPNGTLAWEQSVDVSTREARPLLVGQGGTIYVSGRQYLQAISSTGERKWRFEGGTISSAPAELPDGKLAVTIGARLYILDRDGDTVFSREVVTVSAFGLAADQDHIYLNGQERMVLDREGRELFRATASQPNSAMIAFAKGFVQDGLTRYDAKWEKVLWSKADQEGPSISWSLTDPNGNTAVVSRRVSTNPPQTTVLRLYDRQGNQKWELNDVIPASPPVSAGAGRLCLIGMTAKAEGTSLICIGDK